MARALLLIGGILNLAFGTFHIGLFWGLQAAAGLSTSVRSLVLALNGAVILSVLFLAVASLFFRADLLATGLGRLTLGLAAALYLSRAAEEFLLFKFTPVIFGACSVVGALYVAILVMALRIPGPVPDTQAVA